MSLHYIVDRAGKIIGRYRDGHVTRYYDAVSKELAFTQVSGKNILLFDYATKKQIGKFDGCYTTDAGGRMVGRGNLLHWIVYPTAKRY